MEIVFFKQLVGTAMGTPVAVLWAIVYYYPHDKDKLIQYFGYKMPLFVRYIDDIFLIILFGKNHGLTPAE